MADMKRTIEILFEGTNRTGPAIRAVGRDLTRLNASVSSMASPFASITKAVVKLDAVLLALSAAGISYSVSRFASFEDAMLKVKGVMGASEEQYKDLTELTKSLGSTTRYTATEAAKGLGFLAMAGFDVKQSMEALPQVLKLAQASTTDLGTTSDIVTNIMSGFGIKARDLSAASDVLTATFTNSNTNLTELGQAFKYVGPVAKGMGLTLAETSAVLGVLASSGYKAEQGGTAFRNILVALAAPASNAGKLFEKLGVDTQEMGIDLASSASALKSLGVTVKDDVTGNLRPFAAILVDLKAGLEKIHSPVERSAVLIEIFGKRGGPQMAALLEQGAGAVSGLEDKIKSLGGVTGKVAAEMDSGMGGALAALRSAFEGVAISAGAKFSDGLLPPIKSVAGVLRTLGEMIDSGMFDPIYDAFGRFGDELAGTFDDIAKNLPEALEGVDYSGLLDSLGDIGDTMSGLFDGVDLSTPEGLRDAIQGVVDAFEDLSDFTGGVVEVLEPLARKIGDLIGWLTSLDGKTVTTAAQIAGIGAAVTAISVPIAVVTTAITGIGTALTVLTGGGLVAATAGLAGAFASVAIPAVAMATAGAMAGTAYRKLFPGVDRATQSVIGFVDKLITGTDVEEEHQRVQKEGIAVQDKWREVMAARAGVAKTTSESVGELTKKDKASFLAIVNGADAAAIKIKGELNNALRITGELVNKPKNLTVKTEDAKTALLEYKKWNEKEGKLVPMTVPVDASQVTEVTKELKVISEYDKKSKSWSPIKIKVDKSEIDDAKKAIEKIPAVKRFELENDLKVAEIKSQAKTIQTALEWKAKLDIAQVQAGTERLKAVAKNISEMFANTGSTISSLVSGWDSNASVQKKSAIQRSLSKEQERRSEAMKQQKELTKAQIDYLKSKKKAVDSGESVIKIEAAGLEPHLEAILWKVFAAIQIRANEEGLGGLLLGPVDGA